MKQGKARFATTSNRANPPWWEECCWTTD